MEYKPSFSDQLNEDYLCHYGILGMHWGVRRYQNPNGSLTPTGKLRQRRQAKLQAKQQKNIRNEIMNEHLKYYSEYDNSPNGRKELTAWKNALSKRYESKWNPRLEEYEESNDPKVIKAEEKAAKTYLYNQGRYCGKKIINNYGEDNAKDYLKNISHFGNRIYDDNKSLVDNFATYNYYSHRNA